MKKIITLFIITIILFGCDKKTENNYTDLSFDEKSRFCGDYVLRFENPQYETGGNYVIYKILGENLYDKILETDETTLTGEILLANNSVFFIHENSSAPGNIVEYNINDKSVNTYRAEDMDYIEKSFGVKDNYLYIKYRNKQNNIVLSKLNLNDSKFEQIEEKNIPANFDSKICVR